MGDSWTFNNYKTLELIYDTPTFILGQRELARDFKMDDKATEMALVCSVPRREIARYFRSTLVSEGTAFGTEVLTLLKPVLDQDQAKNILLKTLQGLDWKADKSLYWHAAMTLMGKEPENEFVFKAMKNLLPLVSQNLRQRVFENLFYGSYRLFSSYFMGLHLQRRYLVFWKPTIERLGDYLLKSEKQNGVLALTPETLFYLKQLRKVAVWGRTYQVRLIATRILIKLRTQPTENLRAIRQNSWLLARFSGHFGQELYRLSRETVNASLCDKSGTNPLPIPRSAPKKSSEARLGCERR